MVGQWRPQASPSLLCRPHLWAWPQHSPGMATHCPRGLQDYWPSCSERHQRGSGHGQRDQESRGRPALPTPPPLCIETSLAGRACRCREVHAGAHGPFAPMREPHNILASPRAQRFWSAESPQTLNIGELSHCPRGSPGSGSHQPRTTFFQPVDTEAASTSSCVLV